jgi:serine/threonine protein phosphatase PrpC
MGCGSSSQSTSERGGSSSNASYSLIINEKCPHIKMDFPSVSRSFPIRGANYNYELSYVYVSQRGFYPNALGKANQDSYVVCENFGNPNCHMFGVFDGHGEYGDYCSHFAADQVPLQLEKEFHYSSFDGAEMERVYKNAFVQANVAMHKAMFDDSLSGTTGVTAFVKGDTLYVANVGDSRAIIARMGEDEKLKSCPLSVDQTPFRKDERERLKKKVFFFMHFVFFCRTCRHLDKQNNIL